MKNDLRDRLAAAEDDLARRLDGARPQAMLLSRFGFDFLFDEAGDGELERCWQVPADRIAGLQRTAGPGHGQLHLLRIGETTVLAHEWEEVPGEEVHAAESAFPIWIAARLDIPFVLHVAAAQALDPEIALPSVWALRDHIGWEQGDPLRGWSSQREGARFPQLDHAYDPTLLDSVRGELGPERLALIRGGPSGPTLAEREWFRRLGADLLLEGGAVEAIAARHAGRRFAALALVLDASHERILDPGLLATRAGTCLPVLSRTVKRTLMNLPDPESMPEPPA